jgi:hypothetical protein
MVVIFSLFILVATLVPALSAPRLRSALGCTNQLKEMGLAFKVWEGDQGDHNPMEVSATNGGAMEWAKEGNAEAIFQVLANELSAPKILVCPADKDRVAAASFRVPLKAKNVSYFIRLDIRVNNPQEILFGDDNLELRGRRVKPGLLELASSTPLVWSAGRHRLCGNVALNDGSALGVNNPGLASYLYSTNLVAARLAIP